MDPKATDLAVSIVKELFGAMPAQLARAALLGGPSRFEQLLRESCLTPPQCRASLLALVQYNFFEALTHEEETPRGPTRWPVYRARPDLMVQSLRWSRFLVEARERYLP